MICPNCSDEFTPPGPEQMIVASGGCCLPAEFMADIPNPTEGWCGDCKARYMCIMELGIDPGKHGEYLMTPRGGIKFAEIPNGVR